MIGEAGLTTALHEAGYTLTERDPDYVVLGETRTYSLRAHHPGDPPDRRRRALHRHQPGPDRPDPDGPLPATGSVAALISRATGVEPYFVGKPNPLMMRSALNAIEAHSETTAMIGDRMDTDVVAGLEAGLHTILVLTGVTDARGGRALPVPRRRGSSTRSPTSSTRSPSPPDARHGAADLRRRRRAQLGEAHAAPEGGAHAQHRRAAQRPAQAVLHGGDVAEAQRAHAMRRRVVEQPQQSTVGHGEQRLRARPRRGGRDERDVLVALERREQLAPERAPRSAESHAPAAGRATPGAPVASASPATGAPPSGPRARRPSARRAAGRRRR